MRSLIYHFVLPVVLVSFFASHSLSQDSRRPIEGDRKLVPIRVVDADGKPIGGAEVSALGIRVAQEAWRARGTPVQQADWFDAHARMGTRAKTDEEGGAELDWQDGGLSLLATKPGMLAWVTVAELPSEPTTLVLQPDAELSIRVLGPDDQPRGGVPVALYRLFRGELEETEPADQLHLPTSLLWHARTDAKDGVARLPHAQILMTQPEMLRYYVGIAIPQAEPELIEIDPADLPDGPVVLHLPATGSLVVEMSPAPGAFARCRAVPGEDPSGFQHGVATFWGFGGPDRASFVDGRARFEHVELGLELQVEARWDGMVNPAQRVVQGPREAGQVVVVRFEGRDGPGGIADAPHEAVLLAGTRELGPRFMSVHATTAENDTFQLCVAAEPHQDGQRPDLSLRFGGETRRFNAWHSVDGDPEGHAYMHLESPEQARAVADALGVVLALRGERPYRLESEFSVDRAVFEADDEILVTMKLRNAGEVSVTLELGGWQRGANRHARFEFDVRRDGERVPDAGSLQSFGGIGSPHELAPGEELVERALLNMWIDPRLPGDYVVEATYRLEIAGTPFPFVDGPFCALALLQYEDSVKGTLRFSVR